MIKNNLNPIYYDKISLDYFLGASDSEKINQFNNKYYQILIHLLYKINTCNNLLAINLNFKLKIIISSRSGDTQLYFEDIIFYYKPLKINLMKI